MPTIRIDDQVYAWLQGQARPFEDTPNSVLRRIAGLEEEMKVEQSTKAHDSRKTPQYAYRNPILKILNSLGGQADRLKVLKELEEAMKGQLTDYDKSNIKSGSIRWQKGAEFEVYVMRQEGLLKSVDETYRSGIWALTPKGKKIADSLDD